MPRRTPNQYDWQRCLFDDRRLTKHFTSPRRGQIKHIDIHHMTVRGIGNGSALDACYNIWQTRPASGHYGVDGELVAQFVSDNDAAWGNGDSVANHEGIVIEHANSAIGDASGWPIGENTFRTGARLVASLHRLYGLGRPWSNANGSAGTIRAHRSFTATQCPGPWFMANWLRYVALAQSFYDQPSGGTAPAPIIPKGDDMAYMIRNKDTGGVYVVAPGHITHLTDPAFVPILKDVVSTEDRMHELPHNAFVAMLDAFGIPRFVLNPQGNVEILNAETQKYEGGGHWSWARYTIEAIPRTTIAQSKAGIVDKIVAEVQKIEGLDPALAERVISEAADKAFDDVTATLTLSSQ